jgi:membrane protease YdiL (CAAX protease family)
MRNRAFFVWGGLFEIALGVLAIGVGWLFDLPVLDTLTGGWREVGLGLLASLPMLVLFVVCIAVPWRPFLRIKAFTDDILRPLLANCTIVELAALSLGAGLGEELLFRAALQGLLTRWFGQLAALVVASVVFGLMHAITPTYAMGATLLGAWLGWCWQVADSLLVAVVAHAFYDFVALVALVHGPRRWFVVGGDPEENNPIQVEN